MSNMDGHSGVSTSNGADLPSHPASTPAPPPDSYDLDALERQTPTTTFSSSSPSSNTPETNTTKNSSTSYLDGLRGLAAFSVFIQHCIGGFDDNAHEHGFGERGNWHVASFPILRLLFSGGGAAVAVFFVLSGFVLSRSPLRAARAGQKRTALWGLASAVVRRPVRLYAPTLMVTLGFAVLLHVPGPLVRGDLPWPGRKEDVFVEVLNWVVEAARYFNPFHRHTNEVWFTYGLVVWTIPIELKGSMLVYALAAVHARFSGLSASPGRSVLIWSVVAVVLLQTGFWTMACFLGGLVLSCVDVYALDTALLARYPNRFPQRTQTLLHASAFVAGLYLLSQPAHAGFPDWSLHTPGWGTLTRLTPEVYGKNQYYRYWTAWGAALLVWATLRLRAVQGFLRTRPLQYLGRVSFMFYLVHVYMQYMVGDRLSRMLGAVPPFSAETWWDHRLRVPDFGPWGFNSQFVLTMAVMFPLDLVVADFLTKWLDAPCVRLGKKLAQRLGLEQRIAASRKLEADG